MNKELKIYQTNVTPAVARRRSTLPWQHDAVPYDLALPGYAGHMALGAATLLAGLVVWVQRRVKRDSDKNTDDQGLILGLVYSFWIALGTAG